MPSSRRTPSGIAAMTDVAAIARKIVLPPPASDGPVAGSVAAGEQPSHNGGAGGGAVQHGGHPTAGPRPRRGG